MRNAALITVFSLFLAGSLIGCSSAHPVNTPPLYPMDKDRAREVYAHYPDPTAPRYDHGYYRLNRSGPVGVIGGSGAGVYLGLGGGISRRETRSGQDYRGPDQLDYGGRLQR